MQPWSVLKPSDKKTPDVHWEKVSELTKILSKGHKLYTDYTGVIEHERLRAVFQHQSKETEQTTCVSSIIISCHMTSLHFLSHDTLHFLSHDVTPLPVT